jgi:site-specific DNA-methyltransferase (adenine-specific)
MIKQHFVSNNNKINIYQADCMDLLKDNSDNYYDLAIIDPPYGINVDEVMYNDSGTQRGISEAKRGEYELKKWDKSSPNKEYFDEIIRVSKNQIIFGANHFISKIPYDSPCWIIWDKQNGNNGYADCELAWTSFKSASRKVDLKWNGMLQFDMKNKEKRIHPTQKPIRLYEWILDNYAKPNFKIIDTHLGSFSSAIASHFFGCEFTGIEIDNNYFNNGVKRFMEKTLQTKIPY